MYMCTYMFSVWWRNVEIRIALVRFIKLHIVESILKILNFTILHKLQNQLWDLVML